MLAMLLVTIGSVGATSGFMLYGIAGTIVGGHDTMSQVGIVSMIVGSIMTVVGGVMYRSNEKRLEESLNR